MNEGCDYVSTVCKSRVDSCDIHIVEVIIDIGLCNSAIVSGGMK
jgi:hypothetical protein